MEQPRTICPIGPSTVTFRKRLKTHISDLAFLYKDQHCKRCLALAVLALDTAYFASYTTEPSLAGNISAMEV